MRESLWYFAYGSNMSPAIFETRRGMRPSARTWGWVDGYRLIFDLPYGPGERGVANIVADPTRSRMVTTARRTLCSGWRRT